MESNVTQATAIAALGILLGVILIAIPLAILIIAGAWKVFKKAGKPGWGVIVPVYGSYLLIQIAGRPTWWLVLLLLAFIRVNNAIGGILSIVSFIFFLVVCIDISKKFQKSTAFGFLMAFVPFVGWPILGFGKAQYVGASAGATTQTSISSPPLTPASESANVEQSGVSQSKSPTDSAPGSTLNTELSPNTADSVSRVMSPATSTPPTNGEPIAGTTVMPEPAPAEDSNQSSTPSEPNV